LLPEIGIKGANLHDAIETMHGGCPNRRNCRATLVEPIDTRAIFRSNCRQAGHENRYGGWMALRLPQSVQT
jgi:hypothetical protein